MQAPRFSRGFLTVAATLALGLGGVAYAAARDAHVLNVTLPDGSVAHIHYVGNVPPQLMLTPAGVVAMGNDTADPANPFAEMDRIFAEMQARQAAMLAEAAKMQRVAEQQAALARATRGDGPIILADANAAPGSGAQDSGRGAYHFVSVTQDANGCISRVEETSDGSGAAPKVVRTMSGHCGKAGAGAAQAPATPTPPTPPAEPQPLPADAT